LRCTLPPRYLVITAAIALACLLSGPARSTSAAPLSAGEPIALENTHGNFDFIRIDNARRRLLLAHTGFKSLDVFDLEKRKLLKVVPTGAAQDTAIDPKGGRYFVAVSAPPQLAIVDAEKLEVTGLVPLPAAADLLTFNPADGRVYVCNDVSPELWVIDPAAKKILQTITLPGKGMEDLTFDAPHKHLFQVVKGNNTLVVIDPSSLKVLDSWTTEPATNPHGLALIPDGDTILIAGGAGKLALLNRSSGKLLGSIAIAPKVDELAYDPELHLAYCGSGQSKISVAKVEGDKLTSLGDVSTPGGAKSIVSDPKTHTVWIAYSQGDKSFVQPFTPEK
jgi:DNA-binding beta-propeller fold protein YncE